MPAFHPSPQILEAFAFGKLTDTVASDTVIQHLETCVDCREKVTGMSGDSFLERMRAARQRTNVPADAKEKAQPRSADKFADLPPELRDNQQYEVLRELGRGGMGVVYLAKNRLMDRLEVLKVLSTSMLSRSSALDRFLREIRAAAALSHDNVVKAHSAMQFGDVLVFAMEYVEGDDLAKVVKAQGPLAVANACYYARQVALGLQHAHERGMVHRDIKPHNLILARIGKKHLVKILDFGLAKATSEKKVQTGLTQFGAMLGTPDYMAPEQSLDAATADIRADIYSLGCTLYYLLTGAPPFGAGSLLGLLQAHQTNTAKPLNLVRPEVPVALSAIVATMMAKEPGKRYQKPVEVAQALMPFFMKPATRGGGSDTGQFMVAEPVAKTETAKPVVTPRPQTPRAAATVVMDSNEESQGFAFEAGPLVRNPLAKKKTKQSGGNFKALFVTVLAVTALFFAGVYWGFGIIHVTREGTIILEDVPDGAEVVIDGKQWTVKLPKGGEPLLITVEPGKHELRVRKGNVTFYSDNVAVDVGAKVPIRVRREVIRDVANGDKGLLETKEKFTSLFNGKNLDGWKTHPKMPGTWRVVNGAEGAILTGSDLAPNYLFTERGDYKDFHLKLEARINDRGSASVYFRAPLTPEYVEANPWFATGFSAHINSTYDDANRTGSLYVSGAGVVATVRESPVPAGEWFTMDIIARDNHINIKINGKTTADYVKEAPQYSTGHIALQLHNSGGVVEFRKIEIKEFSASPAALKAAPPPKRFAPPPPPISADRRAAQAVLSLRGAVMIRIDDQQHWVKSDNDLPAATFELTRVNLAGKTELRDTGLDPLRHLTNLVEIDLSNSNGFTDGCLERLRDLSQLEVLRLRRIPITSAGLAPLHALKKLRELDLWQTKVTNGGLAHLKELTQLELLNLGGTQVTGAGLADIEHLTKLRSLFFWDQRVTDADLAHLKGLIELESLELVGTPVTDAGLSQLKGLTKLRHLSVYHTGVTGAGLADPQALAQLNWLNLTWTPVSDANLAHLQGLPRLEYLYLNVTSITDTGLSHLYGLKHLKEINLEKTKVTAAGIAALQKALPECNIHVDAVAGGNKSARPPVIPESEKDLIGLSVPELIKALRHPEGEMRLKAAAALRSLGPAAQAAVPALVQLIADSQEKSPPRFEAAMALREIGPVPAAIEAVPTLLKVLQDPTQDTKIRERIVWALRVHKMNLRNLSGVYPAFATVLSEPRNESNRLLRCDCAYLLGWLQGPAVPPVTLDVLLEYLKDNTVQIFDVRTPTGEKGKGDGRVMAVQALTQIGKVRLNQRPDIILQLQTLANDKATNGDLREACKKLLKTLNEVIADFVQLFNGKDLKGWKTHPSQPGNWRVVKGTEGNVLTGSGPAASYLYTKRGDYKDVHVRVEARINDGGNSGVYCRTLFGPKFPANNPAFPLGYEAQINSTHGDVNKTGSLYEGRGGALVSVRESPAPPGEWFKIELICKGKRITVKVNDVTTADYMDEQRRYTSGHIALQQHNPQTVAEFRKIEVTSQ